MRLSEFKEQDKYCCEFNTPEGFGCNGCPAKDKNHCADALRNLCGEFLKTHGEERKEISRRLDYEYRISPFNQLGIIEGFIELEP